MNKLKLYNLLLTLAVLVFAMSAAQAQDEMPPDDDRPGRPGRLNLLKELGLSSEQVQEIRRINQARRPLMQEAQRRFHEANRALDQAILSDTANEVTVQERMKEVQMAQAEIIKIRTNTEFAIRKLLTPEQLIKFRELRQKFMRPMPDGNPGDNRQQPPPSQKSPFMKPNQPNQGRPPRRRF
jgi:Spy/CpxP family protein refolding chaperone